MLFFAFEIQIYIQLKQAVKKEEKTSVQMNHSIARRIIISLHK